MSLSAGAAKEAAQIMRHRMEIEKPRPIPFRENCYFYHTMSYPDGETIPGSWTMSGFDQYIGGYDLRGKTVLDVGTASGYIAFNAERAGATVTGMDLDPAASEFRCVPFAGTEYFKNPDAWRKSFNEANIVKIKNSWWYSWHKFHSNATAIYQPIGYLSTSDEMFDVVIAGAVIMHLSDPVSAVAAFAKVARESVILSMTHAEDTDEMLMRPLTAWNDPAFWHGWWGISRGLWRRIFANLGFDVEFASSQAQHNAAEGPQVVTMPTIIARRRVLP